MPDVIRHPCCDSALRLGSGQAQPERLHVCPERSGAQSKGLSTWMPDFADMTRTHIRIDPGQRRDLLAGRVNEVKTYDLRQRPGNPESVVLEISTVIFSLAASDG